MACGEERLVSNFTTIIAFPTLIFSFFRFLCLSLKQP